jgi:hypothetical protein
MATNYISLFDKIINVKLIANDGSTDSIICPDIGLKPDINISGDYVASNVISSAYLRITNFYTKRPLSDYSTDPQTGAPGYIQITSGYKNSTITHIYGECLNAFQESPNPDGVTCFEILTGKYRTWVNSKINLNIEKGQPFNSLIDKIAKQLNMKASLAVDGLPTTLNLNFAFNGYVKDIIYKINQMFPDLVIRPDGENLYIYSLNNGTGIRHTLTYLTDAKKDASGFTIIAPWVPDCLPGDLIELNPTVFKASYGSQAVTGNIFQVFKHSFNFSTNDDINEMSLICGVV